MGHTPFGYVIKNGKAFIDEEKANKIRKLYENYLAGMALAKAAAKAGIETYHSTVKRLLENKHYMGDNFYPAIIDNTTFAQANEERFRRAALLGRLHRKSKVKPATIPTTFRLAKVVKHYDNPKLQAEYLYSLIESEAD